MHPQNLPPDMSRRGLVPQMGSLPAGRKPADDGKRPLFDQFLEEMTLDFALDYAPLTGVTISSGSAWFGIKRFAINDLGSDVIWCGHSIMLGMPANGSNLFTAGTYNNLGLQYGGRAALLVVGANLPMTEGVWQQGPSMPWADGYSGVLPAANGRTSGMRSARRFPFAPDPNDSGQAHGRIIYRERTLPAGVMLRRGESLDVALVVGRTLVSGLTQSPGVAFEACIGELTVIRPQAPTANTR